jgi:thioesterase domain-containing protein
MFGQVEELNPERIQSEDPKFPNSTACSSTTAILFHDGGGTTYPYHCLGGLYRNVYGIRNPHFFTGNIFLGGLPEMGKVYADYVRAAIARKDFRCRRKADGSVDILLGGWSLGGMLALEVAHELQKDAKINVVGIVMIDTTYAGPTAREKHAAGDYEPLDFSEDGKTRNEILSTRCMSEAVRMLEDWEPPRWEGELAGKKPKTILIKARDSCPTQEEGKISMIDCFRKDRMLGWSGYEAKMFTRVMEIPGNHFNIFDQDKIESTSKALRTAFDRLTQPSARQRMLAELQCM